MTKARKIFALILAVILMFSLAACGKNTTGGSSVSIVEMETTSPSYNGEMINIASQTQSAPAVAELKDKNIYSLKIEDDSKKLIEDFAAGEYDVISCSLPVAASAFKKMNEKSQIVALTMLSSAVLISTDSDVKAVASLKDKTVYYDDANELSAVLFKSLLDKNSLTDQVTVEKLDSDSIVSKLADGSITAAILEEPYASKALLANKKLEIKSSLEGEFERTADSRFAVTCIVASTDFIANNDAFTQFIASLKEAVEYTNVSGSKAINDISSTGAVAYDDVVSSDNIEETAIAYLQRLNVVYVDGSNVQKYSTDTFKLISEYASELVDKLPSDDVYYISEK